MFFKVKHYQKKYTKYYLNDRGKDILLLLGAYGVFMALGAIAGYIYEHNIDLAQVIQGYIIKLFT